MPEILFAEVNATPSLVRNVRITCDGHEIPRCLEADVLNGYCVHYVTDCNGLVQRYGNRAAIKRISGNVRIERKDVAHANGA